MAGELDVKGMVFAIVKQKQLQKRNARIEPQYISIRDISDSIYTEIKKTLSEYCRTGVMEWATNIGQLPMFKIKEEWLTKEDVH